jgi:carbonic anhydrase
MTASAIAITCMDFRLIGNKHKLLEELGYEEDYDHFTMAGASLGFDNERWSEVAFDHINLAIKLHHISEIIIIDHMDCGAYKLIRKVKGSIDERIEHIKMLRAVKCDLQRIYKDLTITTKLMELDGTVRVII